MKQSLFCFYAVMLISIASEPYSLAGKEATGYQIYIVDPPINNQVIQEHRDLPAICRPATVISLIACRGEYEPASFVVETDSQLNEVLVTVADLAGDQGTIPSSAVDVRVVQPCWLRITDHPGRMNWVLLHDPALLKIVHEENETPFSVGGSIVVAAGSLSGVGTIQGDLNLVAGMLSPGDSAAPAYISALATETLGIQDNVSTYGVTLSNMRDFSSQVTHSQIQLTPASLAPEVVARDAVYVDLDNIRSIRHHPDPILVDEWLRGSNKRRASYRATIASIDHE